ncbi:hypothetical protein PIB30_102186 [Stylosanthes scabra]|uniref:Uncharacterized protein n=1 Tax=Stylosanthes scabra TaxID=79078 RepID=A0ABU6V068_9FABA|nr:hypothetical protein [Stylosanthes scabra]
MAGKGCWGYGWHTYAWRARICVGSQSLFNKLSLALAMPLISISDGSLHSLIWLERPAALLYSMSNYSSLLLVVILNVSMD